MRVFQACAFHSAQIEKEEVPFLHVVDWSFASFCRPRGQSNKQRKFAGHLLLCFANHHPKTTARRIILRLVHKNTYSATQTQSFIDQARVSNSVRG